MGFSGRFWRPSAAVVVAALSLAVPAAAGTPRADALPSAPLSLSSIGIDNFGTVNPKYFRGAQPKGGDYAHLAALGVKTVIDLTGAGDADEPRLVQAAGMKLYRIPMTTHETPSTEKVAQFLKLVGDPANQPVYVHCLGGRHRTGVMTAVYRMTEDRWTAEKAFAEMKQYRYGPDFLHPEFKQFVYAYDAQAFGASSVEAAPAAQGTKPAVSAAQTNR